jgi:nitrite reductase/ring-hydroxylating ferredoxin subunit
MLMVRPLVICRLDELIDPGSKAFIVGSGDWPLRGFLVRRGDDVFAYVNRCPHAAHPLNWRPDQFLTADLSLIECQSHCALFDSATGACVRGPCAGRTLTRVRLCACRNDAWCWPLTLKRSLRARVKKKEEQVAPRCDESVGSRSDVRPSYVRVEA